MAMCRLDHVSRHQKAVEDVACSVRRRATGKGVDYCLSESAAETILQRSTEEHQHIPAIVADVVQSCIR